MEKSSVPDGSLIYRKEVDKVSKNLYQLAYDKLMTVNNLTAEAQQLSEHIEALNRALTLPSGSNLQLGAKIIGQKTREQRFAEVLDIIDKYEQMRTNIERERLLLLHQINALGNDDAAHYLKLRFAHGLTAQSIGYKYGHSERQVYRLVSKGVNRYVRLHRDELLKNKDKQNISN